jgi:transcriptional regulator with XRE-family HTH domain
VTAAATVGDLLRRWRRLRRLSQLDLALAADVSARHLSFVETGRSRPSRDLLLRLAETLEVPVRQRNALLLAAGLAPAHPERGLDDRAMAPARAALQALLTGYQPYPALAVDRSWTMVAANDAVGILTAGADPELLRPPVNVLRLSLHPDGLAPAIVNLPRWRGHVLDRLHRDATLTGSDDLLELHRELAALPGGLERGGRDERDDIAVPLVLRTDHGVLRLLSTVTTFGTALEVTLAELSIEGFVPADEETASLLRALSLDAGGAGERAEASIRR